LVLGAVTGILAVAILWPPARDIFRSGALGREDLIMTAGAGLVVLVVLEAIKPLWRLRRQTRAQRLVR
jgi:P-type Ca2+ transporter type 2C